MKNTLTTILLLFATTSFAQRYITSNVSQYEKAYSDKYTLVDTDPDVNCTWEITDSTFYRDCEGTDANWRMLKVVKIPNGKKYVMDALGMDDIWVVVDKSGFIQLYENNGNTLRKFRIAKKEAIKK